MMTVLAIAATAAGGPPPDFDADGYRSSRYRTPVTDDPAPAQRISLANALKLVPEQVLFIDVMPAEGGVRDPMTGAWRLSHQHLTIAGAQWHPETGRVPASPALWSGLEDAVGAWRARHPRGEIVVFCRIDCWMSWNVARRLALNGVAHVRWFAEGTDGWHSAGRQLVVARPVAVGPEKNENFMEEP